MPVHPIYNIEYSDGWIEVRNCPLYEINWKMVVVRNKKTGHELKQDTNYRISLVDFTGRRFKKAVYQLLLISYLPSVPQKETVDHIDGNRHNNNLNNLQWLSWSEHGRKSGRDKVICQRKQSKPIEQWSCDNQHMIAAYTSLLQAAKETNTDIRHISRCLREPQRTANNFKWKLQHQESQMDLVGEEWKTTDILQRMLFQRNPTWNCSSYKKIMISNKGRILTTRGIKTWGTPQGRGSNKRVFEGWYVHQLVWATWGGRFGNGEEPPTKNNPALLEICHQDGIELDQEGCVSNAIEHLRVDTHQNNIVECYQTGRLSQ